MDETNWSYQWLYSDALESISYINKYFKTEILAILLLTQLIGNRTSCRTIQG